MVMMGMRMRMMMRVSTNRGMKPKPVESPPTHATEKEKLEMEKGRLQPLG
jgi:hypothetical protein